MQLIVVLAVGTGNPIGNSGGIISIICTGDTGQGFDERQAEIRK